MINGTKKRRIVEVSSPQSQQAQQRTLSEDQLDCAIPQVPLELAPAIRSMVGYGKRMTGLGTLRGVRSMEKLLDELTPYARFHPELDRLIAEKRASTAALRSEALRLAGGSDSED